MKDREEKFIELDDEIESWSDDEKNFVLWQLLKYYENKLDIPEKIETIEDYRKEKVNHGLLVSCNELIDMLDFELWR